jgi:hypothetical protein
MARMFPLVANDSSIAPALSTRNPFKKVALTEGPCVSGREDLAFIIEQNYKDLTSPITGLLPCGFSIQQDIR